jgi:hypothetical protein
MQAMQVSQNNMQPFYATVYGNERELIEQALMEMEEGCLGNRLWKRKEPV